MDKDQIINLKKFIKEENNGAPRLNSLRLPRDLTLGGPITKPPKKQFMPNLNITRNKEKAKEALKKNGISPKIKDNKFLKKEPNTDRKRDNGRFVQSSGIFSDGMGADVRRSSRWSDKRSDKENDGGPSVMTMPSLKKKNWVIDKKAENTVFDELMAQDDNDEIDEKLPFHPINWFNVTSEVKKEIKTEGNIQQSSSDMVSLQPALSNLKIEGNHYISNEYLGGIYDDNCSAISLWKMPDSLCGKGLSDDPNCKELFDYCLDNMLEGQIGKLVIRKSGKMEVHIGRGVYQLEQPNLECYSEDIIALDSNTEKGSAATVLAGIKNRYSLNPDWDSLLK